MCDVSKRITEIQCQLGELDDAIYWITDSFHKGSFWEQLGKSRFGSIQNALLKRYQVLEEIDYLQKMKRK